MRKPNAAYRSREHLTEREVERLIETAKDNRWGHRDSTMVLLTFRHGLRASELVDLRWEQIDLENAILHVGRVKQGTPATHPLTGRELRALRRLQREQESKSPFVFVSEHGTPFSTRGFQAMVERAAEAAGFDMKIHPHMLRHSCGFKLANDGVDTRTKPVWRTGVLQMAFPPHLTRKRNQIGRQGESLLACMTANREPSNQGFEIDREATVCTASRRFLPFCGRKTTPTHGEAR